MSGVTRTLAEIAAPRANALCIGPFGSDLLSRDLRDRGVPVVFVRNVRPGRFDPTEVRYVSEVKAHQLAAHRVEPGDVVVTKMGFPPGIAAAYPDNYPAGIITADIIKLTPNEQVVDRSYLVHFLNSPLARAQVERFTMGATRPKVTLGNFREMRIALPPLPEQRRIADILDKADGIRRKRREAITLTEELLRSAFLEMFGDPVGNPRGWPVKPLADVVTRPFQNGAYFPADRYDATGARPTVEMVHMSDAFQGRVERGALKRVAAEARELERFSLNSGDILIARRSLNYSGAAKPCLVPKSLEMLIFESSLIRVTPDPSILRPLYLFFFLSNERARAQYVLPQVTQSTISGINQSGLARVSVLVPDLGAQVRFEELWAATQVLAQRLQSSQSAAEDLFASLSRQAFVLDSALDFTAGGELQREFLPWHQYPLILPMGS